jgi:hypothetical protein
MVQEPEVEAVRAISERMADCRGMFAAIEAARGWAARVLFAAVVGDRSNVLRGGIDFLATRFFADNGEAERARNRLRHALERDNPRCLPLLEQVLVEGRQAAESAALALGIAIGQQCAGVDVAALKGGRTQIALDCDGIKGEVVERRRQLGPPALEWDCDDPTVTGRR